MSTATSYTDLTSDFWIQVFNKGNFKPVDDLIADDYTFNGAAMSRDGLKAWVTGLRASLPDMAMTLLDVFGDGDKVAVRWLLTATNPSTKQKVIDTGTNVITYKNGKGISNWQNGGNALTLLPVLGKLQSDILAQAVAAAGASR